MSKPYKLLYNVIEGDHNSKNYGYLLEKVLTFSSYNDAVAEQRIIANTTPWLVGFPVLVIGDSNEAN